MNFRKSQGKSDLETLLAHGRVVPAVPSSVRSRVLARARATVQGSTPEVVVMAPGVRRRGLAITLAATVAFVVGAAGAAVALRNRAHDPQHVVPPPATSAPESPVCTASCEPPPALPSATVAPVQSSEEVSATRPVPSMSARESYAAELALLQRAQAAYADRNFATTLLLVGEHARRFPGGRLTEEREALRVKALLGGGREQEARKAAAAFTTRFPRSALLPRKSSESASGN